MYRKSFKIASFILGGIFIISLLSIIYVHSQQSKLVQAALLDFNNKIPGQIKLEKSKLVLFKNFPYVSIDLKGVEVFADKEEIEPLLQIRDIYVGFNFWKIIHGDIEIKKIKIADGHIHINALEGGKYDILEAIKSQLPDTENDEVKPLELNLKSIGIKNIKIRKKSEFEKTNIEIEMNHFYAKIKKTNEDIYAKLKADILLNLMIGDSVLASNKKLELESEMLYDKLKEYAQIKPSKLRLAGVSLDLVGSVDVANDMDLDIQIHGEKKDFSLLFAFLPNEYQTFIKRYKNAGDIYFDASIKGKSIHGNQPLIEANFGCKKGYFENINVHRTLQDLNFSAYFTNGDKRNLSSSEFRLTDFNAQPEQGLVKANIIIRNFDDPYVNIDIKTDFDLNFLAEFLQLENIENLNGKVLLTVNYNELIDINDAENAILGFKQGLDSKLEIENLAFKIPGYPNRFKNIHVLSTMKDGRLQIENFTAQFNTSDIKLQGYISSLPALLHAFDEPIEMGFKISSNLIDLKELTSNDSLKKKTIDEQIKNLNTSFKFTGNARDLQKFDYLPKGKFELTDLYAELKNFPHKLHDFDATVQIDEQNIQIDRFHAEIDKTDFDFAFKITNYPKWFKDSIDGFSKITFVLKSNEFYPDNLLTYKGENYLPIEYKNEYIKELYLKGALQLNYIKSELDSFAIEFEESKGRFTRHPLKIESLKGIVYGREGILNTRKLQLKLGNSDALLSMKYHYGEGVKDRSNYFKLRSDYLDFDQIITYDDKKSSKQDSMEHHEEAFNVFELPFGNTRIDLEIKKLNYHKIKIDTFNAKLRLQPDHFLYVDTLSMNIADGHVDLKGYFNGSDPKNIYFSPNFRINNLDMNQVLIKVDNFGQEMLINENIKGKLSGTIQGQIKMYPDLFPSLEKSQLNLNLLLVDGVFVNFAPLRAMSDFFKDKNLNYVRFDTLQNEFTLKNGELNIPAMTINSSLGYMELSGKQSMTLDMNYTMRIPWALVTEVGSSKLFGGRKKSEISEDQMDEIIRRDSNRRGRFITVRLSGNPDDFKVNLGRERNRNN